MTDDADVLGYECKFAINVNSQKNNRDSAVFVKVQRHNKDGSTTPQIRLIKNFKRDVYITKKPLRNHSENRTYEHVRNLQKFTCTDRNMATTVARALSKPVHKNLSMKQLTQSKDSCYIYGSDVSSPTIIKKQYYQDKYPECISQNSLAVLDIETDMVHGTKQIISVSVTMKDKVLLVINEWFMKKEKKLYKIINDAFDKYLGKYREERNIEIDIKWGKSPGECAALAIGKLHEWRPDWAAVWNINFDLPIIINALKSEGYDLAQVFSDPRIPDEYKYFKYDPDKEFVISDSGRRTSLKNYQQWHMVTAASSFHWVCQMASYYMIRRAKGLLPSYALDFILDKELGVRKLNFTEADGFERGAWHHFMQSKHPVLYLIYNIFDCIGCELLDEKTMDLSATVPELCGISEIRNFNSNPSRLVDDIHFMLAESNNPRIIASKGNIVVDIDKLPIGKSGWIITLPTELVEDNGLNVIEESNTIKTLIRKDVADIDIKSAYPYAQIVFNSSRETKRIEVCFIENVPEEDRRIIGLNLSGGLTNATEYCRRVHKTPSHDELLEEFMSEIS